MNARRVCLHLGTFVHEEDRDGHLVLGHELLLLMFSRCCSKRGGGRGSHCTSVLSMDLLPACSRDNLECTVWVHPRTLHLWNALHGQYMIISWCLGQSPPLSGFESYGQVVQCNWWIRHSKIYIASVQHAPQGVFEVNGKAKVCCHSPTGDHCTY